MTRRETTPPRCEYCGTRAGTKKMYSSNACTSPPRYGRWWVCGFCGRSEFAGWELRPSEEAWVGDAQLNRKIAELVMGEPEPEMPPDPEGSGLVSVGFSRTLHVSSGGNWILDYEDFDWPGSTANRIAWQPLDFSGDFDLAMLAADAWLPSRCGLFPPGGFSMIYSPYRRGFTVSVTNLFATKVVYAEGQTAPEAVCRLLLALAEKDEFWTPGKEER